MILAFSHLTFCVCSAVHLAREEPFPGVDHKISYPKSLNSLCHGQHSKQSLRISGLHQNVELVAFRESGGVCRPCSDQGARINRLCSGGSAPSIFTDFRNDFETLEALFKLKEGSPSIVVRGLMRRPSLEISHAERQEETTKKLHLDNHGLVSAAFLVAPQTFCHYEQYARLSDVEVVVASRRFRVAFVELEGAFLEFLAKMD